MERATPERPRERVIKAFRDFARIECPGSSPLYERLSYAIADDQMLLDLAALTPLGQPIPNLLFAAVHYLMLGGTHHPLAAFYPDLTGEMTATGDPFPAFQSFCAQHAATIELLLRSRRVQTNEVRRSACLLPAFAVVAERIPSRPFALVEVGASAGLNLFWDRYRYDYGPAGMCGETSSPVTLRCEMRGSAPPLTGSGFPPVVARVGIDLHPVDARDADETLWLRALIWPEHSDRMDLLQRSLDIVRLAPPEMIAGDALDVLPAVLDMTPPDATLCVFHSLTLNQFSREGRAQFAAVLAEQSRRRPIFEVSLEYRQREAPPHLDVLRYEGGERVEDEMLAVCHPHGRWMEWA